MLFSLIDSWNILVNGKKKKKIFTHPQKVFEFFEKQTFGLNVFQLPKENIGVLGIQFIKVCCKNVVFGNQ